jgi:hypothetical protein
MLTLGDEFYQSAVSSEKQAEPRAPDALSNFPMSPQELLPAISAVSEAGKNKPQVIVPESIQIDEVDIVISDESAGGMESSFRKQGILANIARAIFDSTPEIMPDIRKPPVLENGAGNAEDILVVSDEYTSESEKEPPIYVSRATGIFDSPGQGKESRDKPLEEEPG